MILAACMVWENTVDAIHMRRVAKIISGVSARSCQKLMTTNWLCCSVQLRLPPALLVLIFISPHGTAMPRGLYFTAVVLSLFLFSFFLTPNLWGHWTDLNQTWTHIHIWLLFEKLGPNSPRNLPPRAGGGGNIRLFLGPTLNYDGTYFCNVTWYQQSERNLSSTVTPYMPPSLTYFGPEMAASGWRVFVHPLNLHRSALQ